MGCSVESPGESGTHLRLMKAESLTPGQVLGIVSKAFQVVAVQRSGEEVVVGSSAFHTLMRLRITRGSP